MKMYLFETDLHPRQILTPNLARPLRAHKQDILINNN